MGEKISSYIAVLWIILFLPIVSVLGAVRYFLYANTGLSRTLALPVEPDVFFCSDTP